jgi:hypothetical protein
MSLELTTLSLPRSTSLKTANSLLVKVVIIRGGGIQKTSYGVLEEIFEAGVH